MIISVENLPSKGFGATGLNLVELMPPTYSEVLAYSTCPDYKSNSIGQLKWDLETLIHNKVKGYQDLSAYDLNFIISIRKLLALIDKNKVTISGITYSTEDISFTTISDEIMKVYKIDGHKFHMPNILEIEKKIYGIDTKYYDVAEELLVMSVGMDVEIDELLNSKSDMFSTIEYIKTLVMTQPKIKGGTEDIILFGKSSDLFQDILATKKSDSLKIEFNKE